MKEQRRRFAMFLVHLHEPEVMERLLAIHEKETKTASPQKLSEMEGATSPRLVVPFSRSRKTLGYMFY